MADEAGRNLQHRNARITGAVADTSLFTASTNRVSELKKLVLTSENAAAALVILSDGAVATARHIARFQVAAGVTVILTEEDLAGFKFGIQGDLLVQVTPNATAMGFDAAVEEN